MVNTGQSRTLAEIADAFLSSLPAEERQKVQPEVSKFVRWLGPSRHASDIIPVDVAAYGEHIVPSAVKPLRSLLTYIYKEGFTSISLAPHLKVRKTSPKPIVARQGIQVEATLTPQGYARLELELANLKKQRSQVVEEMQIAAADKDFRENAPLAAAREHKAHLDGRIREIEAILNRARIITEEERISGAKCGDTVVLRDLSSGKEFTYTLVDPREANPAKGRLSTASPLGKAILNRQKGETVEVVAPAGPFRCRIEDILVPSKEGKIIPQ